ncbi:RNA polymerase sigma factor [Dokdonia sp. Hel_I_53]|uniref:RNA polymerase sigma factor n=1 Tax=Dokdonia sp. Hel_I_53 TaxID=1566287 RepID=UPI0011993212|nr:sigma-70 family RNA polymerase sigma factor [Dokdonia sp. Hel_I_53]TVZ52079.1 RNA polymerase sigma-70 factor (ECF subfamily) [Dokdonia sp. Hel_I_53]
MEITSEKLLLEIKRAKDGQQSAFNFLLNSFWNEVYGFQLKRTKNPHDAEDVTIQTFARAFDKLQLFKEEYTFSTWLIAISKNIHIDIVRKRESSIRAQLSERDEEKVRKVIDQNPSPEDALIKEQNLTQLLAFVKQLKPHYQEMINLRYFQEMSYKEMAEEIDEPINNVKVKLLRARRLLSDIIKKADR